MATRDRLLAEATRLFSEKGFNATSMRDLAEALGLQPASLYAHIRSKDELLLEILERAAEDFHGGMNEVLAMPVPADAKFRALCRHHMRIVADNLPSATVHFHEYRYLPPDLFERIAEIRNRYSAGVAEIIKQGIEEGQFRDDIDLSLAALQVLSVLNYTYSWYKPGGRYSPEGLADSFADTFLTAFRAREDG